MTASLGNRKQPKIRSRSKGNIMFIPRNRQQYLYRAKRALWGGSLLVTFVLIINARHDFRVRRNVDTYMTALQKGDINAATEMLQRGSAKPMDAEYLKKRLQEPMTSQMVQSGLESATASSENYHMYYPYGPMNMYRLSNDTNNDVFIAQQFLDKGAKPSEKTLQFALEGYNPKMALYCLKNGVKGEGVSGYSPIYAICNHLSNYYSQKNIGIEKSCMDILLKNKVNLNNPNMDETPLETIISSSNIKNNGVLYRNIVKSLVQGGADVNKKSNNRYVLQTAVENHDVEIVKILLAAGARPNFLLISWYPDGNNGGYEEKTYELKDKITLFSKAQERCWKPKSTPHLSKDQEIFALLKQYGAKKTLQNTT
jgi:hypothetical protein